MARILNEQQSTAGGPYVLYTVNVTSVSGSRTADSVKLDLSISSHLRGTDSKLGAGSSYTLTGYIKFFAGTDKETEYSIALKGSADSWSGTTIHTATKTITLKNLESSLTTLNKIQFRVARGSGSTSSAGYLKTTNCSNVTIEIGHIPPQNIQMTMEETNPLLINANISDNLIVENLSQKKLTFSYELHDEAIMEKIGVYNGIQPYSSTTNPFILDFKNNTLNKIDNKIPLTPYVRDSLNAQSLAAQILFDYIPYIPISLTNTTTYAKRNGQTSGKVIINVNGIYYNNQVGNINQSLYKPIIKYKFWLSTDEEPLNYDYIIPSENISINDGIFSVYDYEIGSSNESDVNYFDPQKSYRIRIQVEDNFTINISNELQIQVGEAIWTEYKDRVDFKKLTIQGEDISMFYNLGDNLEYEAQIVLNGFVTSNTTRLIFTLFTNKSLKNINNIICTDFSATLRGNNGYLNNDSENKQYVNRSGYTINCYKSGENAIRIVLDKSSAYTNIDNNTLVSAYLTSLQLTLNYNKNIVITNTKEEL